MTYDPTKPYKHQILKLIQSTWDSPWLQVKPGLYPTFERTFQGFEVDHTDGIGTKGELHWQHRTFAAAVQDALAMNLNDLAMVRAQAYKLQNHIVLPADDHQAILEIVSALVKECRQRQIVMTGGETSVHGGGGFDLSLTVSGRVLNSEENRIQPRDVILGLPSSGIHSNGLTRAREILGDDRNDLVTPTLIYADKLLPVMEQFPIHGMMHITGGAFTKLKDIAQNVDLEISWPKDFQLPPLFAELYAHGMSDEDMYRTWNCGFGFILTTSKEQAETLRMAVGAEIIGQATPGSGKILIDSVFSSKQIFL